MSKYKNHNQHCNFDLFFLLYLLIGVLFFIPSIKKEIFY